MKKKIGKHQLPERREILDDFPLSRSGEVSTMATSERITPNLKETPRRSRRRLDL
jgi:hypothetical protein